VNIRVLHLAVIGFVASSAAALAQSSGSSAKIQDRLPMGNPTPLSTEPAPVPAPVPRAQATPAETYGALPPAESTAGFKQRRDKSVHVKQRRRSKRR
jgi:hypothetical protein